MAAVLVPGSLDVGRSGSVADQGRIRRQLTSFGAPLRRNRTVEEQKHPNRLFDDGLLRVRSMPGRLQSVQVAGFVRKSTAQFVGMRIVGAKMQIDPPIISAVSALIGALIGGSTSLVAAIYTQRYQDRLQRVTRELTKRESVYADFIMSASKWLLNAYVQDEVTLDGDKQHLIGLTNRMRLFAPPNVMDEADRVIRELIKISLEPSVELRKFATAELSKNRRVDPLLPFSLACRADLDKVHRTVD